MVGRFNHQYTCTGTMNLNIGVALVYKNFTTYFVKYKKY